jgi:hypothetical protein
MNRGSGWWGDPRGHREVATKGARQKERSPPHLGPNDRVRLAAIASTGEAIYHVEGKRYVVMDKQGPRYGFRAKDDYEAKAKIEKEG